MKIIIKSKSTMLCTLPHAHRLNVILELSKKCVVNNDLFRNIRQYMKKYYLIIEEVFLWNKYRRQNLLRILGMLCPGFSKECLAGTSEHFVCYSFMLFDKIRAVAHKACPHLEVYKWFPPSHSHFWLLPTHFNISLCLQSSPIYHVHFQSCFASSIIFLIPVAVIVVLFFLQNGMLFAWQKQIIRALWHLPACYVPLALW